MLRVWCVPLPPPGTVLAGAGAVYEIRTHGIPVPNPIRDSNSSFPYLIFVSGKMVIAGAKSEDNSGLVSCKYAHNFHADYSEF